MMLKTNIPKLDDLLGGGIKQGSSTAFWAFPGLELSPFAYQVIDGQKSKSLYFTNSKPPDIVRSEMKSIGVAGKNVVFIDAYSSTVNSRTKEITVKDPKDLESCTKAIKSALESTGAKLVVFDSLSTMLDLSEKVNIEKLRASLGGATALFLFTQWPYEKETIKKLRESMDAIVEVSALEEKLFIRKYFSAPKVSWAKPVNQAIPYRIEKTGISVYIPKILVTGSFNSGKSSFIHSASTRAVSVDRLGTTIALDHGHVSHRGFSCDLFGTPGQERFDPILKLLGGEALGVIVVLSSIDPASYERAKAMLNKSQTTGLPTVIVANKANLRGALPLSAIRNAMGLDEKVPVIKTSAADLTKVQPGLPCQIKPQDVDNVLDALFGILFGEL